MGTHAPCSYAASCAAAVGRCGLCVISKGGEGRKGERTHTCGCAAASCAAVVGGRVHACGEAELEKALRARMRDAVVVGKCMVIITSSRLDVWVNNMYNVK